MRIQHNIAAMSSYRNYTNNVSAVNKNLEKLSSGYKINRAGDDAAGLAISEKMRAQITGLETAQKNAKDGISLVKTAEGALQEVHDMLNRMVTLATQSANGTYDNETDRAQLQKEVEQLKTEINRIADSANFNGIKLFDGSMDGTTKVGTETLKSLKSMTLLNNGTDAVDDPTLHKDATGAGKTSFTISLDDIKLSNTTANATSTGVSLEMWIPGTDANSGGGIAGTGHTNLFNVLTVSTTISDTNPSSEQIIDALMKTPALSTGKVKLQFSDTAGGAASTDADLQVEYEVKMGADGKSLEFTMTDTGLETARKYYEANKGTGTTPDAKADLLFRGNFNYGVYNTSASGATDDNQVSSTIVVKSGGPDAGVKLAEAKVNFTADMVQDGAGVQIGDQYYVFAGTDKTYNAQYDSNTHVVDIRDLADPTTGKVAVDAGPTADSYAKFTKALERLSVAAKDNSMFYVGVHNSGNAIVFNEKPSNTDTDVLTTKPGIQSQLKYFIGIDNAKAVSGKSLTLQIGDTSDSFNQMKVNIKDCHTAAIGIGGVDISTQDGAAKAIADIKSAINYVSDVRGTLGATQNRLDHTINNLSVMQENIQDAESTIRDTDIAQEMMAYTKNNILVQSAQAMLAQANQIPQGVLQLLG